MTLLREGRLAIVDSHLVKEKRRVIEQLFACGLKRSKKKRRRRRTEMFQRGPHLDVSMLIRIYNICDICKLREHACGDF